MSRGKSNFELKEYLTQTVSSKVPGFYSDLHNLTSSNAKNGKRAIKECRIALLDEDFWASKIH